MDIFLYIIIGYLFAIYITPILDGCLSIITNAFEIIQGLIAIKVKRYKKIYENIDNEDTKDKKIGFSIPEESEEKED